jgi:hypothetical protein
MTMQEAPTKAREGGYQHNFKHREPSMRIGVVGLHAFSTIQMDDIERIYGVCVSPSLSLAL